MAIEDLRIRYLCEVCNYPFQTKWEAEWHERQPTTNDSLPRGLVIKDSTYAQQRYYRRLYLVISKELLEGHNFDESHNALYFVVGMSIDWQRGEMSGGLMHGIKFPKSIRDCLLTAKELRDLKKLASRTQNYGGMPCRNSTALVDVSLLEVLTNKLSRR